MEDIEEYYEEENEKNKERFIEDIKKEKLEKVEKEYKERLRKLRKKYEEEYRKNLEKEKIKEIEKINNRTKQKKISKNRQYEVENLDLSLTKREKLSLFFSLLEYKIKRRLIDFYDRFIPNEIIYFNYKLKKNIRSNFNKTLDFIKETSHAIFNGFVYLFHTTINLLAKISTKIENISKKIITKISKKKKEEKKEDGDTNK